jgi:ribosomal protein L11 methyltransferase
MIRLAVRVRREQAELVLAELLELAPSGVEELEVDPDVVEYAVYGAPGELPAVPELRASAGAALVEVVTSEVADDWAQRWREFHRPVVIADRLTVRPPWAQNSGAPLRRRTSQTPARSSRPRTNSIDLVIDPGQAFGTGAHATTQLCLELMLELEPTGGPFVDLGCGSGVLAIAAARLGYGPVLALDNDPASVEATIENARANGVELEARRLDLRVEPVPEARTVAANLLGPLLRAWAARLREPGAASGPERLIASGLLTHEADAIATTFGHLGLREVTRRESGEWSALLLSSQH